MIGAPIVVEIDETDVTLVWTVSGAHADNFKISNTFPDGDGGTETDTNRGQIVVGVGEGSRTTLTMNDGKTNPDFDYDDRTKPNPYRIRLNVAVQGGESNQTRNLDVAIHVTNIDEDISIIHVESEEDDKTVPGTAVPPIDTTGAPPEHCLMR